MAVVRLGPKIKFICGTYSARLREEEAAKCQVVVTEPKHICDMDFEELDRELIGPNAWEKAKSEYR